MCSLADSAGHPPQRTASRASCVLHAQPCRRHHSPTAIALSQLTCALQLVVQLLRGRRNLMAPCPCALQPPLSRRSRQPRLLRSRLCACGGASMHAAATHCLETQIANNASQEKRGPIRGGGLRLEVSEGSESEHCAMHQKFSEGSESEHCLPKNHRGQ